MQNGHLAAEVQALRDIAAVVAEVLHIPVEQVTDDLEYRSIMEWDSLAHVNLMLAIEQEYGIAVDFDMIAELDSVGVIRAFVGKHFSHENSDILEQLKIEDKSTTKTTVHRGLAEVVFDRTKTTLIDGRAGKLQYRGYSIHDLAEKSTFEETAYLLLHGALPTQEQLDDFEESLKAARHVPAAVFDVIRAVKHAHPMEVLRTAISALAAFDPDREDNSPEAQRERAIRITAQTPILVAAHHAIRLGKEPVEPSKTLNHAANFLYMLHGEVPTERAAAIINKILILHADHGSNVATFTARVVTGTRTDLYAALTAAVAAFGGALHGGALENVMGMLLDIGEAERAESYVQDLIAKKQPVMGFGHRVYQTEDPRARHLRVGARELSEELGVMKWNNILDAVVAAMRPYMDKGVDVNVDFYASVIYHLLGIPKDVFIPAFVVGRMPGFISQVQEQVENNILIRPLMQYVGDTDLTYLPIEQR